MNPDDLIKPKRPRGKAFTGSDDPRRSNAGQKRNPVTKRMLELVAQDPSKIDKMLEAGFKQTAEGNVQWATLIIAYLDGKPLGREERGATRRVRAHRPVPVLQ